MSGNSVTMVMVTVMMAVVMAVTLMVMLKSVAVATPVMMVVAIVVVVAKKVSCFPAGCLAHRPNHHSPTCPHINAHVTPQCIFVFSNNYTGLV